MAVTTGSVPFGTLDTSFMDNLGLQGYVPASSRGTVLGSYSGTLSGQPVTIAFNVRTFVLNYWHTLMTSIRRTRQHNTGSLAQSQSKFHVYTVILTELSVAMTTLYSGQFSRNLMKPGQYGVTLYQGEIAAATSSVNVNAGCTSSITLTSSLSRPSVVWSIGKYCVRDFIER